LVLLYEILKGIKVNWIYVIDNHMIKSKRLTDYCLLYVVSVSGIYHLKIDVKIGISTIVGRVNQLDNVTLQKMGFVCVENV